MTPKVAVTGAAGHIGRTVIDLLDPSIAVRAIDISDRPIGLRSDVEWVRGNVCDRQGMAEALSDVEVVIHLAAVITIDPRTSSKAWEVNVGGAESTALAARDAGVRRFVHCSSIHAFDCTAGHGPLHENSPRSLGGHLPVYDRSKAAGEARVRSIEGLDVVVLHPGGVIGPSHGAVPLMGRVFRAVLEERMPAAITAPFEWIDVRDVAEALIAATTAGHVGRSYLLGGHHVMLSELTDRVAEIGGVRRPRALPIGVARMAAHMSPLLRWTSVGDLVTHDATAALRYARHVDDAPARSDLGHEPRPLDTTLTDLVASLNHQTGDHPVPR